jgi:hypothetical protein
MDIIPVTMVRSFIPHLAAYINRTLQPPVQDIFEYYFLNYTTDNSSTGRTLVPPPFWMSRIKSIRPDIGRKSQEMTAMDFFALSFFLNERSIPWFFRGTDDTIINFRRMPSFLAELESEYDPYNDAVVRGDCVVYKDSPIYLQGGSGYLCSRAAARLIADNLNMFLSMWIMAEDTTFGPFLDALGIVRKSCSGAFMGHGPNVMSVPSKLDPARYARACPPLNLSRWPVPHHLARVKDILVFHKKDNAGKKLQVTLRRAQALFAAHESLRWFTVDNFWPKLCTIEARR